MPEDPIRKSESPGSTSDDSQKDDVAGRNQAADLARQIVEEAYSSSPPNKEAADRAAKSKPGQSHTTSSSHAETDERTESTKVDSSDNKDLDDIDSSELKINHDDEPKDHISGTLGQSSIELNNQKSSGWKNIELNKDVDDQAEEDRQPNPEAEEGNERTSVYDRSHDNQTAYAAAAEQWKNYHSSWQQYYQQYYQRYYLTQMKTRPDGTQRPGESVSEIISSEGEGDSTEPTKDIRSQLLQKAQERATAVRKSRHFMPILTALSVALLFLFLQYNRLMIAQVQAYINPAGNINPQNIIVDPSADIKVGPEPKLIIPKINVDAPIVFGINSYNEPAVQTALKKGVVDYPIPGANAKPGQVGNMPILGHSSNDVFDDGAYKFVFVQLNKLKEGDTFFINYQSKRYIYSVTSKEIIDPSQVGKLAIKTEEPLVTLITCDPPGTALKRLIVVAKQIGPDPAAADKPKESTEDKPPKEKPKDISGNSPTVLQRLFQ